jgi:hypothetical protein
MTFLDEHEILEGAINLHLHVGPDYCPRYGDSIKLAEQATEMGIRALGLKIHHGSTAPHAYFANKAIGVGCRCYGGVALNNTCGGLNPRTVEVTIRTDGKIIWLPTTDAWYGAVKKAGEGHWIKSYTKNSAFGFPINFLTITDENGKLKPEMHDILRVCKEGSAILSTGHISPEECLALAKEAKAIGYTKLKITHPNLWMDDFTVPVMKELVACGATISFAYGGLTPHHCRQDPQEIVNAIRELGAKNCIMVTDGGDVVNPNHVQMLRAFYTLLLHYGISKEDLTIMLKKKPAELLDLE